ncbi:MAG: Mrp/NBP35 family ATP-binding protein [Alphaproteobacteria bacterium]|nr:Mrp/NBP35 family ATP-binding protein [Alphaproteobacteria bacterium]
MIWQRIKKITPKITSEQIYAALAEIADREDISSLQIDPNGHILFCLQVGQDESNIMEEKRQKAEQVVLSLKGVQDVRVILTAEKPASQTQVEALAPDPHGMNKNPPLELPIRQIIVVASGKGGVGKSTIAVNLAAALAKETGRNVGLLDADIYGPSVPMLTGLPIRRPDMNEDNKLVPFTAHGLKVMSIGFLVEENAPMIWRGPMVQSAIYQMLRDVEWGTQQNPLDTLIIDMPPGTGDAQLTLAQKVNVTGAVIVSTPQDLALIDARKAIEMFRKTNVPIRGLIENMSTHICSNCGHEDHIFGTGGAQTTARELGIPYLGHIPLSAEIRSNADQGRLNDLEVFKGIALLLPRQPRK